MRPLLPAAFALALAAGPAASAVEPELSLRWLSTTGSGMTGGSILEAEVGDVLALHAFVDAGSEATWTSFSLGFDPDVLQVTAADDCPELGGTPPGTGTNLGGGSCFGSNIPSQLVPMENGVGIDDLAGEVLGFDAGILIGVPAQGPIELLAVEFEVVGDPGAGSDVEIFYEPGFETVNDENGDVFQPMATATLLPEPALGMGVAAGVLGLLALRRRRAAHPAAAIVLGLLLVSAGDAWAADDDGDGIENAVDNCLNVPNAPPLDCDVDQDGYGNACDSDYDNSGLQSMSDDVGFFSAQYGLFAGASVADHDCDGIVGGPDAGYFYRSRATPPGPSGLACAGSIPCP